MKLLEHRKDASYLKSSHSIGLDRLRAQRPKVCESGVAIDADLSGHSVALEHCQCRTLGEQFHRRLHVGGEQIVERLLRQASRFGTGLVLNWQTRSARIHVRLLCKKKRLQNAAFNDTSGNCTRCLRSASATTDLYIKIINFMCGLLL